MERHSCGGVSDPWEASGGQTHQLAVFKSLARLSAVKIAFRSAQRRRHAATSRSRHEPRTSAWRPVAVIAGMPS